MAILAVLYAIFSWIIVNTDPVNTIGQAFDQSIILDGGVRLYHGHVAYRDFATPFGPLAFAPVYLGLKLGFGTNLKGILIGKLVIAWIAAILNFVILSRDSKKVGVMASLLSFSLLNTPGLLGVSAMGIGDVALYTNISYALILPSICLCSMAMCKVSRRDDLSLYYSIFGCCMAIMCKITIGIAGILILAIITSTTHTHTGRILLAFIVSLAAAFSTIHFALPEMLSNLREVAAARMSAASSPLSNWPGVKSLYHLGATSYFLLLCFSRKYKLLHNQRIGTGKISLLIQSLAIVAISTAVDLTNGQLAYGFILMAFI